MRTTLTIEPAVARQLRELMRKQKMNLKAAVNEALREEYSGLAVNARIVSPSQLSRFPSA